MADIQKYFETFHDVVRVDYDMSSELREKRDIVTRKIREYLQANKLPGFEVLLQGSYKMKTGVKPIADLEYDIDIGLRFPFHTDDHTAKEVRGWVFQAVKDHTKRCEDKGPCIRVVYDAGYHLDLVTYCVYQDILGRDVYHLAHKSKGWCEANPPKLLEHVDDHRSTFKDTEDNKTKSDQFRRVVRCLRRWNDVRIPREDRAKPTGLAYVLLCCDKLRRTVFIDGRSDDRKALEDIAKSASEVWGRIVEEKPTPEYEDMFGRLTDPQMDKLKTDLEALANALRLAGETADPVEACKLVRKQLGDDFPVPDPQDTAKKTAAPAITRSSASA